MVSKWNLIFYSNFLFQIYFRSVFVLVVFVFCKFLCLRSFCFGSKILRVFVLEVIFLRVLSYHLRKQCFIVVKVILMKNFDRFRYSTEKNTTLVVHIPANFPKNCLKLRFTFRSMQHTFRFATLDSYYTLVSRFSGTLYLMFLLLDIFFGRNEDWNRLLDFAIQNAICLFRDRFRKILLTLGRASFFCKVNGQAGSTGPQYFLV